MKLLECHVDNFGRLSNFDYQFLDGLTVIQEPNGFGKSTLAAFIKAMLYGFPRTAGRNIASNERKKYLPWQGGTYGGSLDFEFEGISYRVWRTFGKTAAKDRFSLRDLTNRSVSTRFTEKLGEELFQLDAESFMRSVYMPQMQNQETAATTSIQTKLSNLVDNTDDLNNYDSAMDHLRTARSEYRKFRGSGGHIDDIQTQIERLEQKLTDAETKKYPLAEATGKVEALNAEKAQKEEVLSALREKITKASAQQASRALCDQFTGLEKELHTDIPIVSFVAYSGTGKTTFLERLIPKLKARGLKIAIVKHDGHRFEIDHEGKDSDRFTKAGADVTGLISSEKAVLMENRQTDPEEFLKKIDGVDLILTEGFKQGPWPKIMLHRKGTGKTMPLLPEECLAVISDVEILDCENVFTLEEIEKTADFLFRYIQNIS